MATGRRARELPLLDALDALEPTAFEGTVWRVVREGRDPLLGHASGGRWDPGKFDVLYTALDRDGAVAEIDFHLSRQPVRPSKLRYVAFEIAVETTKTLKLADMASLAKLGVEESHYQDILYTRAQEIGDAAAFLGFDGIMAPSARGGCLNLVLFTGSLRPEDLAVMRTEPVDFADWRRRSSKRP